MVVTKKNCLLSALKMKVLQQIAQPSKLASGSAKGPIFSFGRGTSHSSLLLGMPTNQRVTKEKEKSTHGTASVKATSPICITKAHEL